MATLTHIVSTDSLPTSRPKIDLNFDGAYSHRGLNVLSPPFGFTACYGDGSRFDAIDSSGHDDTAAIQAMIDAVGEGGSGISDVLFPGHRAYVVSSTITVPLGVRLRGIGYRNDSDSASPPRIVWDGNQTDPMFMVGQSINNITETVFENLSMCSRTDGNNPCKTFIRYGTGTDANSADSGCYLNNVWFDTCFGDAVTFDYGTTNYYIQNCRWDNCGVVLNDGSPIGGGRYAIYVNLNGGFFCQMFGHNTITCEDGAGGAIFLDGEGKSGATPKSMVQIDSLKCEINDLAETYAAGTNHYDKQGVIRLGVDQDIGPTAHHIHCNSLTVEMATGISNKPISVFQVTGSDGTDEIKSWFVSIIVDGGVGLGQGTYNDTVDTIRPIGGCIPYAYRPEEPWGSKNNWGRFQWGSGQPSGENQVVSFTYAPYNFVSHLRGASFSGCKFPAVAFASLPTATTDQFAWVNDVPNSIAIGGNVTTGGGANRRLLVYNGSNWVNEFRAT